MTAAALREADAPRSAPRTHSDARLRKMLDEHFDFVWRQLRRLGLSDDRADDAAQQVFVVASSKLHMIQEGSERSFLFGTAMRVASDIRRSAVVRREVACADPAADLEAGPWPDELVDQRRARVMLDAILEAMDLDLRSVFVLFEIEEMTTAEIATLLAVPPGTVASRLRRAREEFQERLMRLQRTQKSTNPGGGA